MATAVVRLNVESNEWMAWLRSASHAEDRRQLERRTLIYRTPQDGSRRPQGRYIACYPSFLACAGRAREHPDHQAEASHNRDCRSERSSGLAKRVTNDHADYLPAILLDEHDKGRGRRSAL